MPCIASNFKQIRNAKTKMSTKKLKAENAERPNVFF